jgi:hypothetical protein
VGNNHGLNERRAAEEFEVSASTAIIWVKRFRETGARLIDRVPQGHWKSITFVGRAPPQWHARLHRTPSPLVRLEGVASIG